MLVHVVLMRFDDPSDAEEAVQRLRGLADQIDVVRRLSVGLNVVPDDAAYELGLVAEFESREDLDAYEAHPAHQAVAGFVRARRSASARCDYPA